MAAACCSVEHLSIFVLGQEQALMLWCLRMSVVPPISSRMLMYRSESPGTLCPPQNEEKKKEKEKGEKRKKLLKWLNPVNVHLRKHNLRWWWAFAVRQMFYEGPRFTKSSSINGIQSGDYTEFVLRFFFYKKRTFPSILNENFKTKKLYQKILHIFAYKKCSNLP